jgi:hypothetical protein
MKRCPDCETSDCAFCCEKVSALHTRIVELEELGRKVNDIRNSMVGMQGFNFSEHLYPLVAALNTAGFEATPYEDTRKNLGTIIEQRDKAEATVAELRDEVAELRDEVETWVGTYEQIHTLQKRDYERAARAEARAAKLKEALVSARDYLLTRGQGFDSIDFRERHALHALCTALTEDA